MVHSLKLYSLDINKCIIQPENAFLQQLGITANTDGVFDGQWHAGEGEQFTPISYGSQNETC